MNVSYPPGLPVHSITGDIIHNETDASWLPIPRVKRYTNAFIVSEDQSRILLGLKKRGFGVNKYNGFGGKVEPDEDPMVAAKRELQEEAGIEAPLRHCGVILFQLDGLDFAHYVDIYRAETYTGEITESDEMRPKWFSTNEPTTSTNEDNNNLPTIPYEHMWADDVFWLRLLLQDKSFVGRVDFSPSPSGDASAADSPMVKWWFAPVES